MNQSTSSMQPLMDEVKNPMTRLFQYLGAYKAKLYTSVGYSLVNKVFDIMPPFLTAWTIDSVSGNIPFWITDWLGLSDLWNIIIFLLILIIFVHFFESFFEWLYKLGFMRLAQKVQHELRLFTYNKLQKREISYFEEQRTGNLMAIVNDDINQLERFLNNSFNEIVQIVALVIFAGTALLSVSLPLGLISLTPIPFIILASFYYQRKVAPHYRAVRESVGQLGNRLENNISGIAVIKSFTAEEYELERVEQASEKYRDANYHAIRWTALYNPAIRMLIAFAFAAVLFIGAYWVINDPSKMTLGGLAFFAMMIQRLLWPITRLGQVFDDFERARASARRVFGLIDAPNKIKNADQVQTIEAKQFDITLDKIGFYYKKELPIIKQIDLNIAAGQTIGVAGPTGAGKTSLIKLFLRLYDVTQGRILLNGVDIREIDLQLLRQQIALVSQEVYLFHGTVKENIAYGMPNADMTSIEQAAQKSKLHEFIISLPDGYQSIIGERGIKLSGGQRQRLSIARAILKDAPILILDEATSAVDTETERAIQQNLTQLTSGKTAIIIAHRLSTIRHADKIIVLKDGIVAESGTHDALLKRSGIYADLWNVQIGNLEE